MQQDKEQACEQLIRSLENQRFQAVIDGDFDQFEALAHPELAYVHSSGTVDTLSSYLKKCSSGWYVYKSIDHPVDEIRVYGESVLVIGEMNAEMIINGEARSMRNKSLAVWVKLDEHWKLAAYQATPIKA
ncbi:nuclear transport factor 2 family protein [Pseudomonas kairouanensis]|uniref:Nuclear transport factor 2 family protein n=1 Tax=Pseudomonas kairouanensis TaxID=2293832 RepID=A0A4Z0AWJ2_9PSED|nr:nuclear transport factor 2 family protein [Pseudomonas kairouanensis]TFY91172.1 nuclear transport factor 2 family protein [Pseudomonas kairouanensis]